MPFIWWVAILFEQFSEHYFQWVNRGKFNAFIAHGVYSLLMIQSILVLLSSEKLSGQSRFYAYITMFSGMLFLTSVLFLFLLSHLSTCYRKKQEPDSVWRQGSFQKSAPAFIKLPLAITLGLFIFYQVIPGSEYSLITLFKKEKPQTTLERLSKGHKTIYRE